MHAMYAEVINYTCELLSKEVLRLYFKEYELLHFVCSLSAITTTPVM